MKLTEIKSPLELAADFNAEYAPGALKDAPWCWSPSQLESVERCERFAWFRGRTWIKAPTTPEQEERRQLGIDVHTVIAAWVGQEPIIPNGLHAGPARRLAQPALPLLPVRGSYLGEMQTLRVEWQPKPSLLTESGVPANMVLDVTDYRARERGAVPLVIDHKVTKTSKYDPSSTALGYNLQMVCYAEAAARVAEEQGRTVEAVEVTQCRIYTEGEHPRLIPPEYIPREDLARRYAQRVPELVKRSREIYALPLPHVVRCDKSACFKYGRRHPCPYLARCAAIEAEQRAGHPLPHTNGDPQMNNPQILTPEQAAALTDLMGQAPEGVTITDENVMWALSTTLQKQLTAADQGMAAAAMAQIGYTRDAAQGWIVKPAAPQWGGGAPAWGAQPATQPAAAAPAGQDAELQNPAAVNPPAAPAGQDAELQNPAAVNPPDATQVGQPDPSIPEAAWKRYSLPGGDPAVYVYEEDPAMSDRRPPKYMDKLIALGWPEAVARDMPARRARAAIEQNHRPAELAGRVEVMGGGTQAAAQPQAAPAEPVVSATVTTQPAPGAIAQRDATPEELDALNGSSGDALGTAISKAEKTLQIAIQEAAACAATGDAQGAARWGTAAAGMARTLLYLRR